MTPATIGPDGTCVVTRPVETGRPPVGVGTCKKAADSGCTEAIIAASRRVWPGLTGRDCVAKESRYGVDLYSAECTTPTLSYSVYWRQE